MRIWFQANDKHCRLARKALPVVNTHRVSAMEAATSAGGHGRYPVRVLLGGGQGLQGAWL